MPIITVIVIALGFAILKEKWRVPYEEKDTLRPALNTLLQASIVTAWIWYGWLPLTIMLYTDVLIKYFTLLNGGALA